MLPKKYNHRESEKKWQEYWIEGGMYKFDPSSEKIFSIDTPPPTVNGKIHIGHVFSYSQAEMIARFWRMRGYNVFYPLGFDDNGLPTERLVEKQYKIKANEMKREDFTKLCLETTQEFEASFKKLFISLGFSVDWDLEYSSIGDLAQKTSQKSFIDLYKKDKVYHSESAALWCTECRTAIAQAEVETKVLDTTFNYIKFEIEGETEDLIIATTRPELMPACVCVFVNPNHEKLAKFIGKTAIVPILDLKVPIMADEKVDIEKGSGAVMCCTFGDLTDLEWWRKYKLPLKKAITKEGRISEDINKYAGLKVKDARKQIIEDLEAAGKLIKKEEIEHNVSVHERCSTPIEITISKQWFIKILDRKDDFIEAGHKIKWYPTHMKDRYMNWVENIQWDWCISRQRYFGVPFPVWYCKDCGEVTLPEVNNLPVNPLSSNPSGACKCGCGEFVPESDIMDTWATSSVTPLINTKWFYDNKLIDKIMPMSLRPNSHDIIRTWDFYTIVKNLYHLEKLPWDNVMVSGFVLASKGEKISKSKGNAVHSPEALIEQYSADVLRYWAASGRLGNDLVFSDDELKNGGKLVTKIWNASKFALMHLEDYTKKEPIKLLPFDRWMLSKLNNMLVEARAYLEKYEVGLTLNLIEKFFWNFCDNYIEIVKDRLYKPELHGEDQRLSGQYAMYVSLLNILKVFAIFFPHVCEEIYHGYFKDFEGCSSIHLTNIDEFKFDSDAEIITLGDIGVEIISQVRKYKSENSLSLKVELEKLTIKASEKVIQFIKDVELDIKTTTSSKEIIYEIINTEKVDEFTIEIECNI